MNYSYLISRDDEKCRGCRVCEMACSCSHVQEFNPVKSRIRVIRTEEDGVIYTIPVLCQQCEDPICMNVCPVGAIYREAETGAKLVNESKCLGCRQCVNACPFGGIFVDADTKVSAKCNLCDGDPQCVQWCPFEALDYVRSDKIDVQRKRSAIKTVLESQKKALVQELG